MFRRGSFTSPAVNVMLFQASAEKSEPVCATQIATNRPNAVSGRQARHDVGDAARSSTSAEVVRHRRLVPADEQAERGSAPMTAPVFAVVNTF